MSHHKRVACHEIAELINAKSRHFVNHGAFQMYNLIVGEHQNVFFALIVAHRKCHLVMIIPAEVRIQLHVIQEIMHPAHVPLIAEIQSVILHRSGHLRPCGRFLCNHDSSRISSENQGIDMFKELDCLQVLIVAVLVRNPLTGLLSVIEIQHGRHRVHTQTVHMVMLHPQQGAADQEILDLVLTVIKNLSAPVRMLPFSRVCILIETASVKLCQTVRILWKMCRNPV